MSKCIIVFNGTKARAAIGDTLVDAALMNRILVPHDCCTGQCDTCKVKVISGDVDDAGTRDGQWVHACQATVAGDAVIAFDETPVAAKVTGHVDSVLPLSRNILEVVVRLDRPLAYLPGQYIAATFQGFPTRDYSPAPRMDGGLDTREIVLHIRRYAGGMVSSALGRMIGHGHRVRLRGPFGHAFHRRGAGRAVLVSTGTGFAPIWSIAQAIVSQEPGRPIALVAGARDPADIYMRNAALWLVDRGVMDLRFCATRPTESSSIALGRVTAFLPDDLNPQDTIYAAGAPEMVTEVKAIARRAGAECFADPFVISSASLTIRDRLARIVQTPSMSGLLANPFSPRPRNAGLQSQPALARTQRQANAAANSEGRPGLVGRIFGRAQRPRASVTARG